MKDYSICSYVFHKRQRQFFLSLMLFSLWMESGYVCVLGVGGVGIPLFVFLSDVNTNVILMALDP